MGTNPELAIWNKDKILTFGDWMRSGGTMLGANTQKDIWFVDSTGASRFEAVVYKDRVRSTLFDRLLKTSFDFMSRRDVDELVEILESIGAGEPAQKISRFESRLLYGAPQIKDVYHEKYFRGLRPQDLEDLENLTGKLVNAMP